MVKEIEGSLGYLAALYLCSSDEVSKSCCDNSHTGSYWLLCLPDLNLGGGRDDGVAYVGGIDCEQWRASR